MGEQFDGWSQATATDGKYKGGDHIPGMNVGGWYDAGDYDLEQPAQLNVIQSLVLAYREFDLKYDECTVDETAREVETPLEATTTASLLHLRYDSHIVHLDVAPWLRILDNAAK